MNSMEDFEAQTMRATTTMMANDDNGNRSGGIDGEKDDDGDGDQDHGTEEE